MIRKEQQRFSLRKYKVGVASVFLGTTLSFLMANGGAVQASELPTQPASEEKTELVKKDVSSEDSSKKEQDVVANVPTAELAEENKVEEAKPTSESKVEEARSEATTSEKASEVKPASTETEVANKETAKPVEKAEETKPAVSEGDKPKVRNRRATTEDAVSGDHNSKPVSVSTYLKDGETVDPDITNPNGAKVESQTVPSGYARKEGDYYTYAVWDLTEFNNRYGTKYYARAYKRFDESTDTTVELIDKTTGNVVETKTVTATSGVQKFTTTTTASNSQLTFQVDYQAGTAERGKTTQPFIQNGYEVGKSITDLVAPGHNLTPAEQALYTEVYNARTTTDILNVVEPAYNGRTITDSNAKIPEAVEKTTYYRVVDKNNPTFNANKTDKTVQDYVPNGNEVDLARYTLKAMEGQSFTASGERQFDGYKLYQTADANDKSGYVSRPYKVGTKFMDAERAGIKRIKEIVGEDGTVVVRVYLLDPKQQSKRSDGSLSTDGYMLLAETKPIKPGDYNKEDLVVKKSPLTTIAHTETDLRTGAKTEYPNGKELPFDFQTAAGYTPKKTVFVPFLGDNIGHLSPNAQLERGVNGIGTNVDLLNSLTPYKQPIYYYVKQNPVEVTPEVEKQLDGRVLTDGEFTFKLTEEKSTPDKHEETVSNKDGKATFSKLSFNKVGTYKYKITEQKGSDANVDYDSMTVTMTVNVTENTQGDLEATVKYSSEGGFSASNDDKIFNNYVVAPVVTKFDFTKKLAGRKLKAGEFSFVLKDQDGNVIETVKNDEEGNVTFTELSYDNTKIGTHSYSVEEVIPADADKEFGMTYDTMKAFVRVKVAKNGHTLTTVTDIASTGGKNAAGESTDTQEDTEFNNKVTPPATPEFQPEKFVVSKEKYDITGNKLMNDDDELANEYTETNADPYVDKTTNNEPENLNTKTVKRGSKLVYQVWLDTTKFTEANNIQYVGVSDTYDADKLDVNAADIKAYDSVTGAEVTNKFDIKVENGTITATSKDEFIKDKVHAPVIDTTEFEFGRYYKFDIPATVKESVKAGADIENTANQTVHVYNPVSKTVEKPEKPTQKRVNSVPVPVEMNFTKRLDGRELQANEFEFVLKKDGVEVERVKNDAAGNVVFKTLEFGRDDLGKTYNYTVEETPGADATVNYDTMVATVKVVVSHDGIAKAIVANVTDAADKEFNNTVTPPEEPKFQPEKYVVSKEKYDITGDNLIDDDSELTDKYG
ncbi:Spy0128 family protein, partial [Streptococcus sp. HMSC34B10]|uniref:Spy0128 family protein n=2 Tax=Streptococcus TaxID=1301 RepID=UPI002148ED34